MHLQNNIIDCTRSHGIGPASFPQKNYLQENYQKSNLTVMSIPTLLHH
jgi:hypothetical protein